MKLIPTVVKKALVLDPVDPLPSARVFVDRHYTKCKLQTLYHHAGMFYAWSGACYPPADPETIRKQIYEFLETASRPAKGGSGLTAFQPNTAKVNNFLDALRAICNVPSTTALPCWLQYEPDCCQPPAKVLACSNGLLHLPTLTLQPPTPSFFSLNAVDFAYDATVPAPSIWFAFLRDLWPNDDEAIVALQDIFGYFLTGNTRQQKIFLIAGPKRSGKGTIGRVVTAMLGQANVCNPTIASLSHNFGLAPLIGKPLAIIADARLSGRADQHAIAERLLSISGEDGQTVDRKFLPAWTGRLPTRFLILSNELPRIADVSGALASRFIVLTLTQSFYEREDPSLTDRLLCELPGILNWAIEGWQRLQTRGYLLQPTSSADAIRDLEDLGSPIGAFLRDRCEAGPACEAECGSVFDAWKHWCRANNRDHPGTVQSFSRDLRAAVPGLRTTQRRGPHGHERDFVGLRLRSCP